MNIFGKKSDWKLVMTRHFSIIPIERSDFYSKDVIFKMCGYGKPYDSYINCKDKNVKWIDDYNQIFMLIEYNKRLNKYRYKIGGCKTRKGYNTDDPLESIKEYCEEIIREIKKNS
jgi:hypothetical protein